MVYAAADADSVAMALQAKADCYRRAGMHREALQTLDRIALYLVDAAARGAVLRAKADCCRALGDVSGELSYLEEGGMAFQEPARYAVLLAHAGRFAEAREAALQAADPDSQAAVDALFGDLPREKKEKTAAFLSFLSPAGHLYLGDPGGGLANVALNGAAAGFMAWQLLSGCWVTGLLGGGLLLRETYMEQNIFRNADRVPAVNTAARSAFAERLEALLAGRTAG